MSVNEFQPKKYEDFVIVDSESKIIGHIRVKPSGIHWAPKNGKIWYGVSLNDFATFMEEKGKKKSK
ncbi:MAG: hypothetical protein V1897_19345 [Pseudomonadota bacterium]